MEAVWNLEEKCKLSTKQAFFLLLFAASGVAGLCLAAMKTAFLRRLKSRKSTSSTSSQSIIMEEEEEKKKDIDHQEWVPACGWAAIKTALMGSVRWSRPSKWSETGGAGRETPLPLLEKRATGPRLFDRGRGVGPAWPSHNSDSPVWQRPILMGEKCELPRFSGLILYDENGQICDVERNETSSCNHISPSIDKEKSAAKVVRTTLRDLL